MATCQRNGRAAYPWPKRGDPPKSHHEGLDVPRQPYEKNPETPTENHLKPVTAAEACPVCGKDHKCSVGDDGLMSGEIDGFLFSRHRPGQPEVRPLPLRRLQAARRETHGSDRRDDGQEGGTTTTVASMGMAR